MSMQNRFSLININNKSNTTFIVLKLLLNISFIQQKQQIMNWEKPKPTPSKYTRKELLNNLKPFLLQPSPFSEQPFQQGWYDQCIENLQTFQILVVGAGGLGCQIVKNLALSGIGKIHLIDMDTIQLTNLNRQFLFRQADIGKFKAEAVANFVMRRCPGVEVIPYTCRVQQKGYSFYNDFQVIIGGLDNIEARKFLNSMVHQINEDQEEVVCIYIDGATQGFEGQCIVVEPFQGSCYNCSLLDGLTQQPKAASCTIANTPRTPEHCIQYVLETEWLKAYPNTKRDDDNQQHMKWVYEKALERAKQFKIEGVTEMLTMGVAKTIIPAIASTNAFIAACSTNEALKAILAINPNLKNYIFYKGGTSVSSQTYMINKKPGCPACEMRQNNLQTLNIEISAKNTVAELIKGVREKNNLISSNLYININNQMYFNPFDEQRRAQREKKTIEQLQQEGVFKNNPQQIVITDNNIKSEQVVLVSVVNKGQNSNEDS